MNQKIKSESSVLPETLMLFNLDEEIKKTVLQACKTQKVSIIEADCRTDLIAIGSFLIICDPSKIEKDKLEELYGWIDEVRDKDFQVLFVKTPPVKIPKKLQTNITMAAKPNDVNYFKFLIMKRNAAFQRRVKEERKYDKKIFRLMYIIKELRNKKIVFTKNLCSEFSVSAKTVERDIDLIQSLGVVAEYDTKKRGFRFVGDIL